MAQTINLDKIIGVNSFTIAPTFTSLSLACNVLTDSDIMSNTDNFVKSFNTLTAVGNYFGITSNEYIFAQRYFKSFNGTTSYPNEILFSKYVGQDEQAFLLSQTINAKILTDIKAISTDQQFTITLNSDSIDVTILATDLQAATSLGNVATIITTAIDAVQTGATVTFTSDNRFKVSPATESTATDSLISYADSNTLTDLMGLSETTAPIISQGILEKTPSENMARIVSENKNFVSFSYTTRLYDDTLANEYPITMGLCEWLSAQTSIYVFFPWEDDSESLNTSSTTNMRVRLVENGYGTTASGITTYNVPISLMYGSIENGNDQVGIYAAFYSGMGASIDYTQTNAKINFAAKSQEGLSTNVNSDTYYDALINQGYQVYGLFSSRATNYSLTENGSAGGQYLWLDNIYDAAWLADNLQNSLATLITSVKRIQYNTVGQTSVKSVLTSVAESGSNNGVIESGNVFSEAQRLEVVELVGKDITAYLTSQGYYIYMPEITATQRINREPMQVTFLYSNGGNVNAFDINSVFVQ